MIPTEDPRFACKCCGTNYIDLRWGMLVKELEERIGEPIKITSGYRCEKHNKAVGGSPTSSHCKGLAIDVTCGSSRLRYQMLNAAIRMEIHRIGIYKSFIHMDIDRSKDPRVVWLG
ncbi:MAG: D-Ala-D-Ala carboxypeptidase family metallohydrolase [Dehalococcoidales bacterium]|nr:D-Ala-D-Ala carboxypeptidase family metallohydrolase [Dehalococcoidales bacterium]